MAKRLAKAELWPWFALAIRNASRKEKVAAVGRILLDIFIATASPAASNIHHDSLRGAGAGARIRQTSRIHFLYGSGFWAIYILFVQPFVLVVGRGELTLDEEIFHVCG